MPKVARHPSSDWQEITDCAEADALTDELGEGDILLANIGSDSDAIRLKTAKREGWANIPAEDKPQRLFSIFALGLSVAASR
jgi:hypothetical protein